MDHVIMTAGLNELPVLAAAYRLCQLSTNGTLPRFSVLCSKDPQSKAGSFEQVRRVKERLCSKLGTTALIWTPVLVDPFDPGDVKNKVRDLVKKDPGWQHNPKYIYHLHFTAGTAAMGVSAMDALHLERTNPSGTERAPRFQYETSYLSADDHHLRDGEGQILSPPEGELFSWDMDIQLLAELHGYRLTRDPLLPDPQIVGLGVDMMSVLKTAAQNKIYQRWLTEQWKRTWKKEDGLLEWPDLEPKNVWDGLSQRICDYFGRQFRNQQWLRKSSSGWELDFSRMGDTWHRDRLSDFLNNQALELLVYQELQGAGKQLPSSPRHSLAQHLECHRPSRKKFEIDVAAVFGYSLLAISCSLTLDTTARQEGIVKKKGFEVMYRARQIGGTHAHGIVICAEEAEAAERIEQDLEDDTAGLAEVATVQVWGRDVIDDPSLMRQRFKDYIQKLW